MVKKIISSIILIMIICSNCIYATNIVIPEDIIIPSLDINTIKPDDTTTNEDSENNNSETEDSDNDSNENNNDNSGASDSNKNEENTNTGDKEDTENNNSENNQTGSGSNIEPPKDVVQEPVKNNNQQATNNNIVQKSSEARLKELKIDVEGLTPEFDKNTTEYYVIVDLSIKQIKVTAKAVDNKAVVTVFGNKNLKEGENTITINVKAEDGTIQKYYIHVTKVDNIELANAELEKIEIEGFNLYPTFKSNIYNYNLNVNQDITNFNITAVPLNDKASVTIEGNENLHEGENIIKINVTAANEETVRTYKINTYISLDRVELQEEDKTPAIILIAVLGTCIIALGVSLVVKNRRK